MQLFHHKVRARYASHVLGTIKLEIWQVFARIRLMDKFTPKYHERSMMMNLHEKLTGVHPKLSYMVGHSTQEISRIPVRSVLGLRNSSYCILRPFESEQSNSQARMDTSLITTSTRWWWSNSSFKRGAARSSSFCCCSVSLGRHIKPLCVAR